MITPLLITGLSSSILDTLTQHCQQNTSPEYIAITQIQQQLKKNIALKSPLQPTSIENDNSNDTRNSDIDWSSLKTILKNITSNSSLCLADSELVWTINNWDNNIPACYVLFYESPAHFFLRANGSHDWDISLDETSKLLDYWVNFHLQLIKIYRKKPDQTLLIRLDRMDQKAANSFFEELKKIWPFSLSQNLKDNFSAQLSAFESQCTVNENDLMALISHAYPDIIEIFLELESCATLLEREAEFNFTLPELPVITNLLLSTHLNVERLNAAHQKTLLSLNQAEETNYRQLQRLEQHTIQNKEIEKENAQLLLQFHQIQDELKQSLDAKSNAIKENEHLQAQNKQLQLEKLQIEGDLRIQQKQVNDLDRQVKQKNAEHKEIESENEQLLLQLHQVQEELEQYYLENRQASQLLDLYRETQIETRFQFNQLLQQFTNKSSSTA